MKSNTMDFRGAVHEIIDRKRTRIKDARRECQSALESLYHQYNLIFPPERYSIGEEIFNSVSHGVGALLALICTIMLICRGYTHCIDCTEERVLYITSYIVFGISLITLYLMSTLYHALTPLGAKIVFGVLDHSSIYLLIAGTYTPFCLTVIRGRHGWYLLTIIWAAAALGIVLYAIFKDRVKVTSCVLYVLMGYAIVLERDALYSFLMPISLKLLIGGGVAYTVGIIFYALKKVPYAHSIWHLFVLLGSILHFLSLYTAI